MLRTAGSRGDTAGGTVPFPTAVSPLLALGRKRGENVSALRAEPEEGSLQATVGSLGESTALPVCMGDKLLASPASAPGDRELEGRSPQAWHVVGCGPHTAGHTVDIYHPSPGTYRALTPRESQNTGSWSLRLTGFETPEDGGVGERGCEEAQGRGPGGSQLSEEKVHREGAGGPARAARLLGHRGLGTPLLVLGKGPRIPSPERKGGVGSRGMWELGAAGPLAGQGWAGVLRHKKPGLLGLSEVGWEEPKLNINSQPVVTFPSVPSHPKRPWVKALPKAERVRLRWVETS